jgi:hypothetical protein
VVVEMVLGEADVFDRDSPASGLELDETIYPNPTHGYRGSGDGRDD